MCHHGEVKEGAESTTGRRNRAGHRPGAGDRCPVRPHAAGWVLPSISAAFPHTWRGLWRARHVLRAGLLPSGVTDRF